MKKRGLYIVGVISITLFFLYKVYPTLSIYNQNISINSEVHHAVKQKIYNEVEFTTSNVQELKRIEELKSLGTICKNQTNKPKTIICYNVTGYQHTYTIPSFHLSLIVYTTSYPRYNSGMFIKTDIKPFSLSGNTLYETNKSYIHIYEYKNGENQKTRIEDTNNFNVLPIGNSGTRSYYSFRNKMIDSDENTLLLYYFDNTKPYYYIIGIPSSCDVGRCGMNEHTINLFLK